MKRLLNVVFIAFSFRGVTVERSYGSRSILIPDRSNHDRMQEIVPGFSLFHRVPLEQGLPQGYKELIVISLAVSFQMGMACLQKNKSDKNDKRKEIFSKFISLAFYEVLYHAASTLKIIFRNLT